MHNGRIKVLLTSQDLIPAKKRGLLRMYVDFCARVYQLHEDYTCYIVHSRSQYNIETTAICFPASNEFYIHGKGRAFVDILRSIAHELAHMRQKERGTVNYDELHFSSDDEDQANKFAGELVNAFSAVIGYDQIHEGRFANRRKALGIRRNLGRDSALRR